MREDPTKPGIVLIGGGSGSSVVLRGLKRHSSNVTAIVTMFDTGGSSGLLRNEFGYPPFGDLRQCLLALSDDAQDIQAIREAFEFRFNQESSLNGHSAGNLLMAALTSGNGGLEGAIEQISRLLHVTGRVTPVTLERAELCAELADGTVIRGESDIDLRRKSLPRISRIFLDNPVQANPKAIDAIMGADIVILGPGDLYTSILPNLLAQGIPQALLSTRAIRVYVCNLMTKMGETDNFKASDFVREVIRYSKGVGLDYAVVNTRPISAKLQRLYVPEGAYPVEPDIERLRGHVGKVLCLPLASNRQPLRHDSSKIAEAIMSIWDRRLGSKGHKNGDKRIKALQPDDLAGL